MPGLNPVRPLVAALLVAVVIVGCQDNPVEPAEPLTLEEAEALYVALFGFATDSTPSTPSDDELVYTCRRGGQVRATGDFSEETAGDTTRVTTEIVLDPERCVTGHGGHEFTLVDGSPSIRLQLTMSFVSFFEAIGMDGSMAGGVDWELEDRSGTCMIDLVMSGTLDLSGTEPTGDVRATGRMCGLEVDFDSNVDVPGSQQSGQTARPGARPSASRIANEMEV